jgi:hypothetical protein
MSTQQALALPWPAPSNSVVINPRCSLRIEADHRVLVVAGLPVHYYRAEDAVAEAYAMVPGGFWLRPADGRGTSFLAIGAYHSTLPKALCRRRDGGAQSRGRVAARPTTYLREASTLNRDDEEPGDEQPCDRAPVGRQRECYPQAGRAIKARRERTTCIARDPDRRGEASGDRRS